MNGVSKSSCFYRQIPCEFHDGFLVIALDFTGKSEIYMSSHYEKITKRLNGARSGKSASVSVILAKPFFNTQQEAQEQLPPKLKLEN